jgi:DnaJ-class molecular chaperone
MGEQTEPCPVCGGSGVIAGPDEFGNYDPCDACDGTGTRESKTDGSVSPL